MQKILKNMVCFALAFVTLFTTTAFADSLSNVSVSAAPLSSQQPTLDGMVRVYLSSLGSPTYVSLTISGSYSLSDGTSLSNGETVGVSMNSSTGKITMTRGGTTYTMGSSFTLRRHTTTGSNGIKIAQARKPGNLYPGDLQFKAVSQSSGGYKLYTIAHIYIENYLYGVVPYEMGSSAPLEALKAQAVAARTYTVRMMNARSSWSYDVVDTTGDQTYNGTPSSVSTCNTAVDQTKGILLQNGSSYTATYYSASNGGQTESIYNAWGTSGYSYLGVKDDPFDYANPSSTVKQATVYADASNSSNNASLIALLKSKAISKLSSSGYNANSSNTNIQTIQSITPHTPMYASPSKLYTKMDFELSVSTYNSSNIYVNTTITVTCNIFSELESLLGMGIQSSNNELWSVVQTGSTFKLQARRYGHGIGMSQRGAMYMGQLGFTYDEILGFYYPGSTRVGCIFQNKILSANSSEVISTDENPVDVDDGDTEGSGVRGIVTLSGDAQLAVRSAKSASATVLTVLPNGSPVDVLANDGTWSKITFGTITGYVSTGALSIIGTAPDEDSSNVSAVDGFAIVNANGYLNLRDSGSYSASIITTAPSGAILTVLSWGTSWAHIQYGTVVAYASIDYLTFSAEYPEEINEPDTGGDAADDNNDNTDNADALAATVTTQSGSLNMRQFPQAGSTILTTIPKGAAVSVTSKGASWSGVTYLGYSGYVMTMFLSFTGETADSGDEETTNLQAMVLTQSGSLNLRQLPQIGSSIYCTIPRLQVIEVHSKGLEWSQVTYNGNTGYVMTVFLSFIENENPEDSSDDDADAGDTDDTEEEVPLTAIVSTESGSLNLRIEAVAGSKVLTRIPQGETIEVLQRMTSWTYTCYQEYYGYVMNAFLTFSSDESNVPDTGETVSATVTTESGSLNMRDEPYGKVLIQIPQFGTVTVHNKGSAWCYISYAGTYGYVMTSYLTFAEPDTQTDDSNDDSQQNDDSQDSTDHQDTQDDTPNTGDEPTPTEATVAVGSGSLNMRASRSDSAEILIKIPDATIIPVVIYGDDWCKVTYGAYQGYVQTQFLSFGDEDNSTEDTSDEETNTQNYNADNAIVAWVNTASGSLNLRETASSDADVLIQIPQYAKVEVLSDIQATWCQTAYDEFVGYTLTEFLTTTEPDPDTGDETQTGDAQDTGDSENNTDDTGDSETSATIVLDATLHEPNHEIFVFVRPAGGATTLALYEECSESSERITNMAEDSQVEVIQVGTIWCEVLYFEQQGYCLRDGLSFIEE